MEQIGAEVMVVMMESGEVAREGDHGGGQSTVGRKLGDMKGAGRERAGWCASVTASHVMKPMRREGEAKFIGTGEGAEG